MASASSSLGRHAPLSPPRTDSALDMRLRAKFLSSKTTSSWSSCVIGAPPSASSGLSCVVNFDLLSPAICLSSLYKRGHNCHYCHNRHLPLFFKTLPVKNRHHDRHHLRVNRHSESLVSLGLLTVVTVVTVPPRPSQVGCYRG